MKYLSLQLIHNQIHCDRSNDCLLTACTLKRNNVRGICVILLCMSHANLEYVDRVDVHAIFIAALVK